MFSNIFFDNKAQMTSEYAILISIIIAALIGMQIYLKRGIHARLMDAAEYPVRSGVFNTSQYEPGYVDSNRTDTSDIEVSEEMERGGAISRSRTEIFSSNLTSIITNYTGDL